MRSKSSPPRLRHAPYHLPSLPRSSPGNPPTIPQQLPPLYNVNIPIRDFYSRSDPDPAACALYVEQANLLAKKKELATFDRASESYVRWNCSFLGIDRLAIALRTGQLVEPAYCHHIINPARDPAWCELSIIRRHLSDPNLEVVGYFTAATHVCHAQPLYSANERIAARQPLMMPYCTDLELSPSTSEDSTVIPSTKAVLPAKPDFEYEEVLADSDVTFNTDQFVYQHPDLCILYTRLHSDTQDSNEISLLERQRQAWGKMSTSRLVPTTNSRYSYAIAEQRKRTDAVIVESMLLAAEAGQYDERPSTHPAFNTESVNTTPNCLKKFHDRGAEQVAFARTGYSYTGVFGIAIVYLTGMRGLSAEQFCELRKRSIKCLSCLCYFSFEGYQRHIEYQMVCQNTPALERAPDLTTVFDTMPPLPVQCTPGEPLGTHNPSLTNPIGLAWLMWNSPSGVTHDVWVQLITAYRQCPGYCGKIRTFKAHIEHFEESTRCAKVGDEECGIVPRDNGDSED